MRDCQGTISGCDPAHRMRLQTDDEKAQTRRLRKHWEELRGSGERSQRGLSLAAMKVEAAERAKAAVAARKAARTVARAKSTRAPLPRHRREWVHPSS